LWQTAIGTVVGADGNIISGNYVGTDFAGASAKSNATGIGIGSNNNIIGGTTTAARSNPPSGNLIEHNFIGTDITGSFAIPNTYGIDLHSGAQNTVVGGSPVAGNVIGDNYGTGIIIGHMSSDVTTVNNSVRCNSIFGNDLAIDLGFDRFTPNHMGGAIPGPNYFQNFPVISSVATGTSTSISGTFNSGANMTYTLDFYASPPAQEYQLLQGRRYLGSASVTTDASGNAAFSLTLAASTAQTDWITATATDPSGNTSEMSDARAAPQPSSTMVFAESVGVRAARDVHRHCQRQPAPHAGTAERHRHVSGWCSDLGYGELEYGEPGRRHSKFDDVVVVRRESYDHGFLRR
jgi:hypothetical protein